MGCIKIAFSDSKYHRDTWKQNIWNTLFLFLFYFILIDQFANTLAWIALAYVPLPLFADI